MIQKRFLTIILLFFSTCLHAQSGLQNINSWAIQLQNINISQIVSNNTFELMVIDYSSTGEPEGIFSSNQISQIKSSGKKVLAYLSIGEAETYRWYWQNNWDADSDGVPDAGAPAWLGPSNPEWLDNYKVRYWDADWQNIIFTYLDVIIAQGFDGIYCDIVDAYYYWEFEVGEKSAAASAMIQFVSNIRNYVNSHAGSSFYIVTQNGESVTDEYDVTNGEKSIYFKAIQGQGCEGLFFRGASNNNYNPDNYRLNLLNQFKANGISVFSIEYLTQQNKIDQYLAVVSSYNFIPYVSTRLLDTLFDGINLYGNNYITLSGNITYYSTSNPVKDTKLILSGGNSGLEYSNSAGDYTFSNLNSGDNYVVTPSKSGGFSPATILSYDAAMAAQIALGFIFPTEDQKIAADVDKDGIVLMYDASLIAQFAVGLTSGSSSHAGVWFFNPKNRYYPQLNDDAVNQNFQAIVLGDVDGNWSPGSLLNKEKISQSFYDHLQDLNCAQNEKITIPIIAEPNEIIYSCDLKLRFDPAILKFDTLLLAPSCGSFFPIVNDQVPGILRIGCFGAEPITQPGKYLEILFDVTGSNGKVGNIELLTYRVNSDDEKRAVSTIIVDRPQKGFPEDYKLFQNYPNPFNSSTKISYSLSKPSQIRLDIFNVNGNWIKTLQQGKYNSGFHQVTWGGKDYRGELIPSGIYFYVLKRPEFSETKRMILIR